MQHCPRICLFKTGFLNACNNSTSYYWMIIYFDHQLCLLFSYLYGTYGSLYVTLCFVLWRFDFCVLTFDFHILSFLFCVLCTMLFILNGAIHEVETRYRRKDWRKRSCKNFNAFIVHVMLVGIFTFEIHAAGNYQKVKNIQVMLQSGFSLSVKAFK